LHAFCLRRFDLRAEGHGENDRRGFGSVWLGLGYSALWGVAAGEHTRMAKLQSPCARVTTGHIAAHAAAAAAAAAAKQEMSGRLVGALVGALSVVVAAARLTVTRADRVDLTHSQDHSVFCPQMPSDAAVLKIAWSRTRTRERARACVRKRTVGPSLSQEVVEACSPTGRRASCRHERQFGVRRRAQLALALL
jgi:hypothetical protein